MVNWGLSRSVAKMLAQPPTGLDDVRLPTLDATVRESQALVERYTQLVVPDLLPNPQSVSRADWIDVNLASIAPVLDPVVERSVPPRLVERYPALKGPVDVALGSVLAVEAGVLSGVLAQRVLGQYEFPILDPMGPSQLLFVAPNIANVGRKLSVDSEELLRWIALHEVTHAVQFGAVGWLRPFLAATVKDLLVNLEVRKPKSAFQLPSREKINEMVALVRKGELVSIFVGEKQRAVIDSMQGLMAVLEGYAEHVMDVAGPEYVGDVARLRSGLDRKRSQRSGFLRFFDQIIGLEMKLRQYQQGKAFCDAVVEREGIVGLNRVWTSDQHMPTAEELGDAERWSARVDVLDASS